MIAQDVIKLAVKYIGEADLALTDILGGQIEATGQQIEKVELLLDCVNDVVQTLSLMYFPLKFEESVNSSTGIVNFADLTKPIVDILKLTDEHNLEVDYTFFPTHFEAKKGKLNLVYTYMPDYVHSFREELEVAENKVSERLLALGVVARYFMFVGMYSDAEAWNMMFERACLVSKRRKDNVVMRKRRWI